jgi:hypothetical protein
MTASGGATTTPPTPSKSVALPALTSGFSTAAETEIRTGAGQNQVQYNINAPVSIDGGTGFDKVVVLGTEFADHIVVTDTGVYGAGLTVTYENVEVLEIDGLEGDDIFDVLSTAPGLVTRLIGGLGSDVVNVGGDVIGDVYSPRTSRAPAAPINHLVTSDDPRFNGKVIDGIDLSVVAPEPGRGHHQASAGFTAVPRAAAWTATPLSSASCPPRTSTSRSRRRCRRGSRRHRDQALRRRYRGAQSVLALHG